MRPFFRTDLDPIRVDDKAVRTDSPRRASLADAQRTVLLESARLPAAATFRSLSTTQDGLAEYVVRERRERFGDNAVDHDRPAPAIVQLLRAFTNPFVLILVFLVLVMLFTEIVFADPDEGPDATGVITVSIMVLVSATLRFRQEYRSSRTAEELKALVRSSAMVTRTIAGEPVTARIPIEEVVRGDIVQLAAGDLIPADVRFVRTTDLQVNQSMLTGESLPAEKTAYADESVMPATVLDAPNLGFLGTSVASGSATAVVLGTGRQTAFGRLSSAVLGRRPQTAFDRGISKVTFTLITFMAIMVPVVFVINGLTKDWGTAFLFGVTTAVGLTPEMLPLVVTANLAKGAQFLARRKVVVKRLDAVQNLGAMDVLATDKTGTLTEDKIRLAEHVGPDGSPCGRTLELATANAHFQTGLRSLLDEAVVQAAGPDMLNRVQRGSTLVDEVPFDFERRRMSVIIDRGETRMLIVKGAVEEVLSCCTAEALSDGSAPLAPGRLAELDQLVAERNAAGMRVLAIAVRELDRNNDLLHTSADEAELTLVGFLAFLDPAKESAGAAIARLRERGVGVVVITGDNPLVAAAVCRDVGIDPGTIVLGPETEELSLAELGALAEETTVFAKTSPMQKARIVEAMRAAGRTVGYLGDGINDAAALRAADVGVSVDTAVDIAKESADIILLEKDLTVLEGGVMEGRRTFVNTMKYITMTASSNFGNMFSVLVASAMLPFIPMIPIVVLVQNLAYDLAMLTLPWDRVDEEDLKKPRRWDASGLASFMLRIGPISSIFDISTFALMWFVFQANSPEHAALFQSGWFIESIISQTLIVHMLRTRRLPFVRSRASLPVLLATGAVCVLGLVLPFTGWGTELGLVALPWSYFPWLVATLVAYCVLTQLAKTRYIRRFGRWI